MSHRLTRRILLTPVLLAWIAGHAHGMRYAVKSISPTTVVVEYELEQAEAATPPPQGTFLFAFTSAPASSRIRTTSV